MTHTFRTWLRDFAAFDTAEYAEIYLAASTDWRWMAVSLITNAEREGDGAKRLWSLAACSDDLEIQRLLKQHAAFAHGRRLRSARRVSGAARNRAVKNAPAEFIHRNLVKIAEPPAKQTRHLLDWEPGRDPFDQYRSVRDVLELITQERILDRRDSPSLIGRTMPGNRWTLHNMVGNKVDVAVGGARWAARP